MSDIRKARELLKQAIGMGDAPCLELLEQALPLLDRKKPAFRTPAQIKALTFRQKADARRLREQGLSMHQIAIRLGTNHGRISEALSEH